MVRKNVITGCKAALERGKGQMDTAGDISFVLRIMSFCKSFIYPSKQFWAPTAACQHLRINAGNPVCKELICRETNWKHWNRPSTQMRLGTGCGSTVKGGLTTHRARRVCTGAVAINHGSENEAALARVWRDGRNSREGKQYKESSPIHLHLGWIALHVQVLNLMKDHFSSLKKIFCLRNRKVLSMHTHVSML